MHEVAIAEELQQQVRAFAPAGTRVRRVCIEVGGLEHIDPAVMATAWSCATLGGELERSELEVQRVPVEVRCKACGAESQPEDLAILTCRECGAVRPEVIAGSGILLRSLEVEEEE